MSLVSMDELYNDAPSSKPMGFDMIDMLATLNGASDLTITDALGRVSGFS